MNIILLLVIIALILIFLSLLICDNKIENFNVPISFVNHNNIEIANYNPTEKGNKNNEIKIVIPKSLNGEKGLIGDKGPIGDKGKMGNIGKTTYGLKGLTGDPGKPGLKGISGQKSKGKRGERGLKGLRGEIGEKGFRGDKGDKGDKGEKGDTGKVGIKGDKGEKGDTGNKGERGDKGPTGYSGDIVYSSLTFNNVNPEINSDIYINFKTNKDLIIGNDKEDIEFNINNSYFNKLCTLKDNNEYCITKYDLLNKL